MSSSNRKNGSSFEQGFGGAGSGALLGGLVAFFSGAITGAAVGWYNEATLIGDEYEELFVGFSEYSMWGMGFLSAMICGVYGAGIGAVSGAVAQVSQRETAGIAIGIAVLVVLWAATDLFHDGRNQAGFVWFAGAAAGSVAAGIFAGKILDYFPSKFSR